MPKAFTLVRLAGADLAAMRALNRLFGDAFAEPETYDRRPPADDYLVDLLANLLRSLGGQ